MGNFSVATQNAQHRLLLPLCAHSGSHRFFVAALAIGTTALAQPPASIPQDDATSIQALVSSYARALGGCHAEEFADLFAPEKSYFASGFRGQMAGRERLIALVQSERHCVAAAGATPAPRPGGSSGPTVVVEPTPSGARGVADMGAAVQYQDEYVKTANGWRFLSAPCSSPPRETPAWTRKRWQPFSAWPGRDSATTTSPTRTASSG